MFLVDFENDGIGFCIFTYDDPRQDGFPATVIENASLDYPDTIHEWPIGSSCPDACLGIAPTDPCEFRVFKYRAELRNACFRDANAEFAVEASWADFVKHSGVELQLAQ